MSIIEILAKLSTVCETKCALGLSNYQTRSCAVFDNHIEGLCEFSVFAPEREALLVTGNLPTGSSVTSGITRPAIWFVQSSDPALSHPCIWLRILKKLQTSDILK